MMGRKITQGPMTPYGRAVTKQARAAKTPQWQRVALRIVAILAGLALLIGGALLAVHAVNDWREKEYLATRVVLVDEAVDVFYELFSSEAMQNIDAAVEEYFAEIYPRGETLNLASYAQTDDGDYSFTLTTDGGATHSLLVIDDGSIVTIEIDDGAFSRSYENEPHPDD